MAEYDEQKGKLDFAIVANILLTIFELAAGFLTNSVSVIAVAFHDFSDVLALAVSRIAFSHAEKGPTERMTFGFHRITVLAALFNSVFLLLLTLYVMYQGVLRFLNPVPIDGNVVGAVAIVSMIGNGIVAHKLWRKKSDLNIRAAFWHMLDDFLGGAAVLIVAIVVALTGWSRIDGIASILVSLIVLKGVWRVVKETLEVMMEAVPAHIRIEEVEKAIGKMKGVRGAHDIHVWTLGSDVCCLSAHVKVGNAKLGELQKKSGKIKEMLEKKFGITHATIEMECADCNINGKKCV